MKKQKLVCAVAAALYSTVTAHAASVSSSVFTATPELRPVSLHQTPAQKQQQLRNQQNSFLRNDGLNVRVKPQKPVFLHEEGLTGEHIYIVRLRQAPVSLYQGGIDGLTATQISQPGGKQKLFSQRSGNTEIEAYQQYLKKEQHAALQAISATIGARELRQQYLNTFNGFSLQMSQDEAAAVSQLAEVLSVTRSRLHPLHTDIGPQRISADKVWNGQTTLNVPFKGEGTVVGIIDTGVNSDHPSFADQGQDGYDHRNPLGTGQYLGDCRQDEFASRCNDKLIGIYSYPAVTDTYQGLYPAVGEDVSGHGSHTASTAAGNVLKDVDYVVPQLTASGDGTVAKTALFPQLSGVAPHANIVSYQACLPLQGCPTEAILASIEDAVADGVDAINFSIGNVENLTSPWQDPIELAFLGAHQAGISVAASAGNAGSVNGQETGTYIDHVSPWLLNVAASTTGRTIEVDVKLQNFSGGSQIPVGDIAGGGLNDQALTGVVISAANFGNARCLEPFAAGTFDNLKNKDGEPYLDSQGNPANIIVACQRGENARLDKSVNVAAGGAEGFILYNATSWGDESTVINTDKYAVPGIHISMSDWYKLNPWLNSDSPAGHQLTISATAVARKVDDSKADQLADFSSRGPSLANPEHLVPSVTAPGVDIYAATNDESPFAQSLGETPVSADFGFMSGTSMAAPHVAGALALLTQAHPDWTVAQKQAALQLTAEPDVMLVKYPGQSYEQRSKAEIYRAGTGRINVASALNAGLVMDETYDNMLAANPDNGGLMHKLNVPEMVNFSCKPVCTWVRTFTATQDGSWSVDADEISNWSPYPDQVMVQPGAKLEIVPNTFTLKKGQSQTIMVRASVIDSQDIFGNSEVELHSHLILTETSKKAPDMRLPVVFKFNGGELPERLQITAHRNNSSFQINDVNVPAMSNGVARVFETVKAQTRQITLPKDDDFIFPYSQTAGATYEDRMDEATHGFWMDVPAGSKRLIVENLRRVSSDTQNAADFGNTVLYVGKDFNSDGVMDPQSELICISNHTTLNNFCNLNSPEAGKYWAVFYNPNEWKAPSSDTFEYSWGVVGGKVAADLTLDAPQTDGKAPVDLTFRWNMPQMQEGDTYYTAFDLGTSANNPGNIGLVPLKLMRGADDVSLQAGKTSARVGQKVDYRVNVLPNLSGVDRGFTLTAAIPAGFNLTKDDVTVSDQSMIEKISLENGVLTIKGKQPNTLNATPKYQISSSDTDSSCKVPDFGQGNDSYLNLADFGITPSFGHSVDQLNIGTQVPYNAMFNDDGGFTLYNNQLAKSAALFVRGNGNVSLDGAPYFFPAHYPFPYNSFPHQAIGTLWRGWGGVPFALDAMTTPLDTLMGSSGISVASSNTGWAIIEWDGARTTPYLGMDDNWNPIYGDAGDRFEFELFLQNQTRFGKAEYEMIMAYNQLDFNGNYRGSVGLQGYVGQSDIYGPLEGYLGETYAIDNLDTKLSKGKVLCYDYQGPESSQFNVQIQATVASAAIGSDIELKVSSQVDGMADIQMSKTLIVPGNLTLGVINPQQVAEDAELKGVQVVYADEDNNRNQITVSGANVTATVHGHDSGARIDLKPAANFTGATDVTVTVADLDNPADKTSTTFRLNVTAVNDAPQAKVASSNVSTTAGSNVTLDASVSADVDGDSLTYQWKQTAGPTLSFSANSAKVELSGLTAGTYSFSVTASDGQASSEAVVNVTVTAQQTVTVETKASSGGAIGGLMLSVLALAGLRRRFCNRD